MNRKAAKSIVASIFLATIVCIVAGCAAEPKQTTSSQEGESRSNLSVEWSPSIDCSTCHVAENDSLSDASCLAGLHEQQNATCISCHTDSEGLTTAHADMGSKDPAAKLKKTTIDDEACLACHEDYAALAEKSAADGIELVDTEGTAVNPHEVPGLTESHKNIACVDCHASHVSDADTLSVAQENCISCHHQEVYECGTCHE